MTTKDTTNQPLPLYKRLDEERTPGEWYSNDWMVKAKWVCPDNSTNSCFISEGKYNFNGPEGEANAQYTALAVNNLAALAEALENLHSACMNGDGIHVEWWNKNKETVAKAKEALARIS